MQPCQFIAIGAILDKIGAGVLPLRSVGVGHTFLFFLVLSQSVLHIAPVLFYHSVRQGASRADSQQGDLIFHQRLEQEANSLKRLSVEASHLLFRVGNLAKIEERKHKRIEYCERVRSRPFANLTGVLTQRNISTVMEAVFDGPMIAGQCQQTRGTSFLGSEAGDPIDHLLGAFEGMFNASAEREDWFDAKPVTC